MSGRRTMRLRPMVGIGVLVALAGGAWACGSPNAGNRTNATARPDAGAGANVPRDATLRLPDGTELATTRYGAERGPLVVMIHGGPSLGRRYLERALLPLAADYEVIAYDQRGAGESTGGPPDEAFGVDRLLADVDAVADRLGRHQFFLLGHSWGAHVALAYAARRPGRLLGLVLSSSVGPGDDFVELQAANLAARTSAADSAALAAAFSSDAFAAGTKEGVGRLMRTMYRPWFARPEHADRLRVGLDRASVERARATGRMVSEASTGDIGWDEVSSIAVRTLLVHGTADVVPVEISRRLAERMPNAELVELEATGHFPMIERPEEFAEVVGRFLEDAAR